MPNFTQNQREITDRIAAYLGDQKSGPRVALIEGLSGFGKSLVAQEVARVLGDTHVSVISQGRDFENVDEKSTLAIIDIELEGYRGDYEQILFDRIGAVRDRLRKVIVLSNVERKAGTDDSEFLRKGNIEHEVFALRALTDAEVEKLAMEMKPDITPDQIELVKKFSIGIPLLVERIVSAPRLTEAEGIFFLKNYIRSYFQALWNVPIDPVRVCAVIRKKTGRDLDETFVKNIFLELPRDDFTNLFPSDFTKQPHSLPLCAQTMDLYREFLEKRGERVRVFIPDADTKIDGPLHERFEAFSVGRKVHCRHLDGEMWRLVHGDNYTYESMGDDFFRKTVSRFAEWFGQTVDEQKNPLYFSAHDHPKCIGDQIGAGYALETYLQGEGIGYFVVYSFRPDKVYFYNPATKQLEEREMRK